MKSHTPTHTSQLAAQESRDMMNRTGRFQKPTLIQELESWLRNPNEIKTLSPAEKINTLLAAR